MKETKRRVSEDDVWVEGWIDDEVERLFAPDEAEEAKVVIRLKPGNDFDDAA